jgi:hypothetical protein
MPGQANPVDAPDDFFRIRLVCSLLDGCGMCFDRGSLKKKLDAFLTFFQVSLQGHLTLFRNVVLMPSGMLVLCAVQGRVAYGCGIYVIRHH